MLFHIVLGLGSHLRLNRVNPARPQSRVAPVSNSMGPGAVPVSVSLPPMSRGLGPSPSGHIPPGFVTVSNRPNEVGIVR